MKYLTPQAKFILFLFLISIVRWIITALVPLGGDEAYYVLWSHDLAAGYYDHPPVIAIIIKFFTWAFGDSLAAVRVASVLFSAAASFLVYLFALQIGTERTAWTAGILTAVLPIIALKALEMSPDSIFVAFTVASVYFLHLACKNRKSKYWLLAGLFVGLSLMTKLIAVVTILGFAIYLVLSKTNRRLFASFAPYMSLFAALVVFSPFLLWNANHDWVTFTFHFARRMTEESAGSNHFGLFLLHQVALASPLLFVLSLSSGLTALIRYFRRVPSNEADLMLAVFGLLPLIVFGAISFTKEIFPHWTMIAYPFLLVLVARDYVEWQESSTVDSRTKAGLFKWAAGLSVFLVALVYIAMVSPGLQAVFVRDGKLNQIYAYEGLRDNIENRLQEEPGLFVLTDSYDRSAALSYYLDTLVYSIPRTQLMGKQYLAIQDFSDVVGNSALYIDRQPLSERESMQTILDHSFESLSDETVWEIKGRGTLFMRDGFVVHRFYVTECHGLKKDHAFFSSEDMELTQALSK